ncbi:MAG: hypothetical protein PVI23_12070 [Maricaulaceae bacterium]|jgi:hypothetical protein
MLVWILAVGLGVALVLNAASLGLKLWRVREDGGEAWTEHREDRPESVAGLDEAAFRRAYYRAYGPRGGVHAFVAILGAALVTWPALTLLGAAWRFAWRLADQPIMWDPGRLIWMFYLFFGLIACWILVAVATARHYHRNRPLDLPHELARERERASVKG